MPVTYPKNEALRAAAGGAPRGRCMVETDSPYLSPRGCRGRRNEPALVVEAAAFIAARRRPVPVASASAGRLSHACSTTSPPAGGTIVFARDRRARLLDALRPPAGHTLDRAAATTFTLDLATALTVPLAFAGLRLDEQPDPVEIMAALRGVSGRLDIFCQAGAISAGRWPSDLVARIEDVIHEVKRPRPGHLFPPKIWLLRFIDQSQEPSFRLLVLSRHLTADRSWDTILWLDGRPGGRPRASNTSLVQFVAALPAVAVRPVAPKDGLNNPP